MKFVRVILPIGLLALSSVNLALNADEVKEEKANQSYKGIVPGHKENYNTDSYFRGASSTSSSPWTVNFKTSEEGAGTVMRYWIEDSRLNNLVHGKDIKQGSGWHDYNDLRYHGDVHMAVENNNDNSHAYEISGLWDEE